MRKLPLVADFMTTKLKTLSPEEDILEAVQLLLKHKISGAPVVDDQGKLVGVLSEKDCLTLLARGVDHDVPQGTVSQFMSVEIRTMPPEMDIYYAAGKFLNAHHRRFPVVQDGKLIGLIARRDILRAMSDLLGRSLTGDL
jgi:CBS domain-containing protein